MIEFLTACVLFAATPVPAPLSSSGAAAEDLPLQRAAREYRIQIYDTFREMRPQYDRRRAASERLLQAYWRSGRDPAHRVALLEWFHAAESSSRPEQPAPLPEFEDLVAMMIANEVHPVANSAGPSRAMGQRPTVPGMPSRTGSHVATTTHWPASDSVFAKLGNALARAATAGPVSTSPDPANEPNAGAMSCAESPAAEPDPAAAETGRDDLDPEMEDFNRELQFAEQQIADEDDPRVIDIARWLNHLVDLKAQRDQIVAGIAPPAEGDDPLPAGLLSLDPAIATLGERIESVRIQLEDGEFAGSEDARQRELDLLDVLDRQFEILCQG